MENKGLYNYHEINSFCKSEGINTELFINELNKKKKGKRKGRVKMILLSILRGFGTNTYQNSSDEVEVPE